MCIKVRWIACILVIVAWVCYESAEVGFWDKLAGDDMCTSCIYECTSWWS